MPWGRSLNAIACTRLRLYPLRLSPPCVYPTLLCFLTLRGIVLVCPARPTFSVDAGGSSFVDDRYDGGDLHGNGDPPSTARRRDPSFHPQSNAYGPVAASPPTDAVTTTPGGPHRRPPPAFIADGDRSNASSYTDRALRDSDMEMRTFDLSAARSLQLPSEATPSGDGATWGGEQGGGGGSTVSATRFRGSVRFPESRKHQIPPSVSRPLPSTTTTCAAAVPTATPAAAELFSNFAHSFHGEHGRKEGRDLPSGEAETTAAHLFTPPLSVSQNGNPPHRGSPPRAAGSSPGTGTMASPMSARVDVLQALLTPPATTGGAHVAAESKPASAGERGTREKLRFAEAMVAGVKEASGGDGPGGNDGDGVRRSGGTGNGADALERLLLRSSSSPAAVSKSRRASVDSGANANSDTGAWATSDVCTVARRVASRQGGVSINRGGGAGVEVDLQCDDCPRMPDDQETSSPSKQLRGFARRVDAAASGDEHAGSTRVATPLGTAEIGGTSARRRCGGDGGGNSSGDSGSGGIGGYRNESDLFQAARGVTELPQSPRPGRPLAGTRWRDIREGVDKQNAASGQDQSELEELEVRA